MKTHLIASIVFLFTSALCAQSDIIPLFIARSNGPMVQGDLFYHNGTRVVRLPAGTSGYYLKTQGSGANPVWAAGSGGAGDLTIGSSPITGGTSGRLLTSGSTLGELTLGTGVLTALGNAVNGSGGLLTYGAIGTNVQAYNANLTTYAGIAPSPNVQALLGAANYAAMQTQLGLVIGTDVQAYNATLAALSGLSNARGLLLNGGSGLDGYLNFSHGGTPATDGDKIVQYDTDGNLSTGGTVYFNVPAAGGGYDTSTLSAPATLGHTWVLPAGSGTLARTTDNISGTAAGLSAPLAVSSAGTGQTTYTNGQLLIGNTTGNTLTKATLTQGTGITITNGGGSITIAAAPPLSSIGGLGTGVATALAVNVGSAGAPVLYNGAGGTPISITLTNGTDLPVSGITSSTSTALGLGSLEIGHASDTTLTRVSAGVAAIEGNNVLVSGGPLGTPDSGTVTNLTGTASGMTAGQATAALGLKTATTTVSVSSSTAPSAGQVLTATSSTAADWETPSGGLSPPTLAGINSITSATGQSLTLATLDSNKDIVFTPHGTGQVILPAGTTSKPGLSIGQSDTGFSAVTPSRIQVSANGAVAMTFYSTGVGLGTGGPLFPDADDTVNLGFVGGAFNLRFKTLFLSRTINLKTTTAPTPLTDAADLYAKDVSGTAELFVMDEAGNETQISPHNTEAPDALVDSAFDEIGYTANYFTGIITYTNKQRQIAGRPDAQFFETFEEHNERLNLQGRERLVIADWDANQAVQVVKAQEAHDTWDQQKTDWLADPKNAGKNFDETEPKIITAKPKPQWLVAQLAGKEAFLAKRAINAKTVNMDSMRFALKEAGLYTAVVNVIQNIPVEADQIEAQIWWDTSKVVTRNHPLVLSLASALGQSPEQVDALFEAAKLKDAAP